MDGAIKQYKQCGNSHLLAFISLSIAYNVILAMPSITMLTMTCVTPCTNWRRNGWCSMMGPGMVFHTRPCMGNHVKGQQGGCRCNEWNRPVIPCACLSGPAPCNRQQITLQRGSHPRRLARCKKLQLAACNVISLTPKFQQ